jgi:opacity protein-like surface antigen
MMKSFLYGIAALLVLAGQVAPVYAAQRIYVWTEEYGTLAKGNAEFEFWNTAVTHDVQTRNASDWTQKFELEYGITDHLNASLYQVYEQAADSSSLTYVGYNFELKYRVAEANALPLDVLLYAENEASTVEGNLFEGKIVLAKDIGRLNIAYNQIYERVYSTGEKENGYAAGISYEAAPWLRVGVEAKGSYTEGENAAGPTIAWMGNRIWANIGAVYGLNRKTNDREVRFLLGVPF